MPSGWNINGNQRQRQLVEECMLGAYEHVMESLNECFHVMSVRCHVFFYVVILEMLVNNVEVSKVSLSLCFILTI